MLDDPRPLDPYNLECEHAVVLGTHIHALRMNEVRLHVERAMAQRQRLRIGVVNAAKLVNMLSDEPLQHDVRSSDLVLADGMSVVWAANFLNQHLPERVAGIDLMHEIMGVCDRHGHAAYLLGASEQVSMQVEQEFRRLYPNARIAGRRNGYFDSDEEETIAMHIRDSNADVLFLAMTSPKKENFMGRWGDAMRVPVIHGVGGSFDVVAGKVRRAPAGFQKLGLEWFYRMMQEPSRLGPRYARTNYLFLKEVLNQKFRSAD
ncbi:MAG: WecB/TagA/CpsF family glycosyltransferase [Proteobacteria bacterium]|nr:WecB/TagA/CpsF family glycosyltransferase [Pseudomonadota bacterium]